MKLVSGSDSSVKKPLLFVEGHMAN